jgi:hypothetical protein
VVNNVFDVLDTSVELEECFERAILEKLFSQNIVIHHTEQAQDSISSLKLISGYQILESDWQLFVQKGMQFFVMAHDMLHEGQV